MPILHEKAGSKTQIFTFATIFKGKILNLNGFDFLRQKKRLRQKIFLFLFFDY